MMTGLKAIPLVAPVDGGSKIRIAVEHGALVAADRKTGGVVGEVIEVPVGEVMRALRRQRDGIAAETEPDSDPDRRLEALRRADVPCLAPEAACSSNRRFRRTCPGR